MFTYLPQDSCSKRINEILCVQCRSCCWVSSWIASNHCYSRFPCLLSQPGCYFDFCTVRPGLFFMSEVPAGNVCMHKDIQQSCRGARCKKGSCSQDKVPKRQPVGKGLGTPAELVPTEAVAVEFHACSTFPLLLHIAGFAAYLAYMPSSSRSCVSNTMNFLSVNGFTVSRLYNTI